MLDQNALSIGTGFFEVFVFAGNIFGWPSLHFVLENETYFADRCNKSTLQNFTDRNPNQPSHCKEQEASFNLVFTLAVAFLHFLNFPLGIFFDYFGTWIYRTLATTLYSFGYLLIATSSPQNSAQIYPAMIFVGVGGLSLLTSNIQTANFSKSAKGVIVTLLNGLFDSSVAVFFVFKKLNDIEISINTITSVMTCFSIFLWVRTYVLLPKSRVPYSAFEKPYKYGWKQWICFRDGRYKEENKVEANRISLKILPEDESKDKTSHKVSFRDCLKTVVFWTNVFHFAIISFRLNIFLGTFQVWLKGFGHLNAKEISHFTDIISILLMLGVFASPLNGLIIDIATKKLKQTNPNHKVLNLKVFLVSMSITSLLGIILSIFVVIPTTYPSFVFLLLTRGFLYGGNAAFVSINFPVEHFGKLFGITNLIAGLLTLLQYAVVNIALDVDSKFYYINRVLLFTTIVSLVHPFAILKSTKTLKLESFNTFRKRFKTC